MITGFSINIKVFFFLFFFLRTLSLDFHFLYFVSRILSVTWPRLYSRRRRKSSFWSAWASWPIWPFRISTTNCCWRNISWFPGSNPNFSQVSWLVNPDIVDDSFSFALFDDQNLLKCTSWVVLSTAVLWLQNWEQKLCWLYSMCFHW